MAIFKVENFDKRIGDGETEKNTRMHWLLPKTPMRMIILGKGESGKSNLLVNLICKKQILFHKILMFTPDIEKDKKTRYLIRHFEPLQKAFDIECKKDKKTFEKSYKIFSVFESLDKLPLINSINKENKENFHTLVIVNDMVSDGQDQKLLTNFFMRARHSKCSIIYISQTWFPIPKDIRRQVSDLMIFKMIDQRDIGRVADVVSNRIDKKQFEKLYKIIIKDSFNFMYIDFRAKKLCLHIRKNFDYLYQIDNKLA